MYRHLSVSGKEKGATQSKLCKYIRSEKCMWELADTHFVCLKAKPLRTTG